ncbi:MAG: SPASM domain-containing protein [Lachnospiraceae bacterium]|nr:SPASM domain-containing protein [Lachnospiraceae bacterium]
MVFTTPLNLMLRNCNVYPCNSFLFCLGNLQSTSLKDILLSQGRKMLLSLNKSDLKLCKSCGVNHVCLRCPGYALLEGNGLYGCSEISKRTASAHLLSCNM